MKQAQVLEIVGVIISCPALDCLLVHGFPRLCCGLDVERLGNETANRQMQEEVEHKLGEDDKEPGIIINPCVILELSR